jgi:ribosomal-protein-alanine N-acetyltransferase
MVIQGENNINLVSWNETHFHALYSLANNKNIAKFLKDSFPSPYTIHDAKHWIEFNCKFSPPQNFAIEFQGKLVGSVGGEIGKNELRTNMEIGFWVAEPFWGKGIASEAVMRFSHYVLLKFPEVKRLFAQVFDSNLASLKVLENAGFVPEAILRHGYIKNGHIGDVFQYVLTREDAQNVE